jgi:hypothetical protein
MAAIFSTNHRVEGWNVSQTKHGFMRHLMGHIYLPSIGRSFERYGVYLLPLISDVSRGLLVDCQLERCDRSVLVSGGLGTALSRRQARQASAKVRGIAAAAAMLHQAVDAALQIEPERRGILAMDNTLMVSCFWFFQK